MLTFQDLVSQYWKYYLALENRFLETERYVEFDLSNGMVYSMEYMMLFQTICSEIDVVGKAYAGICEPSFKADKRTGLNEWWFYVTKNNPKLVEESIVFRNKIKLQPWKNYRTRINPDKKAKRFILEENAGTPAWWNAYNGAKHDRAGNNGDNYKNASLQNVLTALSGLYSLEASLLENTFDPSNDETLPMRLESRLFDKKLKYYTNYVSCTD